MHSLAIASAPIDIAKLRLAHKTGIGGSEVAALFGKSPWRSIHQIWLGKTQPTDGEPAEMQVHQEFGLEMEPVLVKMYLKRQSGVTVIPHPELMRHPKYDFMIGHLDGLICGADGQAEGVLELKTAIPSKKWQWGSEEMEEIPAEYNLQVHHYMAITGLQYADVVVMFGTFDFRIYRVNRNEELINIIIARCKDFWENYVVPRKPPEIDGSDGATEMLRRLYPDSTEDEMLADGDVDKLCRSMFGAIDKSKVAEEEAQILKNQVMAVMESKAVLSGPGYRITYKQAKERVKTDFKGIVEELKPPADLIAKYTTTEPGLRSFRPGKIKE